VYFSECIIIFTSNLGIYIKDEFGSRHKNVSPGMPYKEVKEKVESGIKHYFNQELGRPEILNRIGNNLVVFDYISPESAKDILRMQVKNITDMAGKNKKIQMEIDPEAMDFLYQNSLKNLENGGRGIGNVVEQYFINPLSRYLYDNKIAGDCSMRVKAIIVSNNVASLDCEVTQHV
jgi:ATP-dependent Clp protease ATP-binding subunit ClpA